MSYTTLAIINCYYYLFVNYIWFTKDKMASDVQSIIVNPSCFQNRWICLSSGILEYNVIFCHDLLFKRFDVFRTFRQLVAFTTFSIQISKTIPWKPMSSFMIKKQSYYATN